MSLEAQLAAATRMCKAGDPDACRQMETIQSVMQQTPKEEFNWFQKMLPGAGAAEAKERQSQEALLKQLLDRQQPGYATGGLTAAHTCPYCGK